MEGYQARPPWRQHLLLLQNLEEPALPDTEQRTVSCSWGQTLSLTSLYQGSSEPSSQLGLDRSAHPAFGLPSPVLAKNPSRSSPHPEDLITLDT